MKSCLLCRGGAAPGRESTGKARCIRRKYKRRRALRPTARRRDSSLRQNEQKAFFFVVPLAAPSQINIPTRGHANPLSSLETSDVRSGRGRSPDCKTELSLERQNLSRSCIASGHILDHTCTEQLP